jgi:TPR repeat protein
MRKSPILAALLRHKVAAGLIAAQIALTLAIIANALYIVIDRSQLMARPSGVAEQELFVLGLTPNGSPEQRRADLLADLEAVRKVPGVVGAYLTNSMPLSGSGWSSSVMLDADDDAGVEALRRAAETGYTPAQLHLAGLFQDGIKGVAVNLTEARTWARRAAEGGDARGMHAYGMYLFDGVGGNQNRTEALDWLKRAAEAGLVDSQYNVAKLFETGDVGIAPDLTQAYKWYLIAARAGDGDAQSSVERLEDTVPAAKRSKAKAEAEQFTVEPLA